MPGFNVSKDTVKIISFINRNCANCQRGQLIDNVPTCMHQGTQKDMRAEKPIRLTDRCTVNARNSLPSIHCYAFKGMEEYDPFQ